MHGTVWIRITVVHAASRRATVRSVFQSRRDHVIHGSLSSLLSRAGCQGGLYWRWTGNPGDAHAPCHPDPSESLHLSDLAAATRKAGVLCALC